MSQDEFIGNLNKWRNDERMKIAQEAGRRSKRIRDKYSHDAHEMDKRLDKLSAWKNQEEKQIDKEYDRKLVEVGLKPHYGNNTQ